MENGGAKTIGSGVHFPQQVGKFVYRKILGEICNISGVAFLSLCLLPVGCGACDR